MSARAVRWLAAALLLVAAAAAAGAQAPSPLVAELAVLARRYHEDPRRLDTIRDALARDAADDPHPATLAALARAWFLWGEIRATSAAAKLEAYDRGREAARRALERTPRDAATHFWFAVNTARWGQTKGIVRSLFLLPTVQEEIRTILELDPGFTAVYALAGNVYLEVPRLLGGDLERAERMFRTGLGQDPRSTGLRVGLAKTLVKTGRIAEARRELEAVLAERAPTNPADWTMKDVPEARALLETLRERS